MVNPMMSFAGVILGWANPRVTAARPQSTRPILAGVLIQFCLMVCRGYLTLDWGGGRSIASVRSTRSTTIKDGQSGEKMRGWGASASRAHGQLRSAVGARHVAGPLAATTSKGIAGT